jgi:hypothetical protein
MEWIENKSAENVITEICSWRTRPPDKERLDWLAE